MNMSNTPPLQHAFSAAPVITPENQAYFDAAREGRLLIKDCEACDRSHFYPRALCPFCLSSATRWRTAAGKGRVYSYTVVTAKPQPYVLAYVALEEGVTLLTQLVGISIEQLRVDMTVDVRFVATSHGFTMPVFTAADLCSCAG